MGIVVCAKIFLILLTLAFSLCLLLCLYLYLSHSLSLSPRNPFVRRKQRIVSVLRIRVVIRMYMEPEPYIIHGFGYGSSRVADPVFKKLGSGSISGLSERLDPDPWGRIWYFLGGRFRILFFCLYVRFRIRIHKCWLRYMTAFTNFQQHIANTPLRY